MRDEDDGALLLLHPHLARMTEQYLDHALDHLHDVVLAFAQIVVVDLLELLDQVIHLLLQGPLGIAELVGDDLGRHHRQRAVGQDHQMRVDEGAEFGRRVRRQLAANGLKVGLDRGDGVLETLNLLRHQRLRDQVMRDFQQRMRDQMRAADGDAAGDAYAVHGEAHRA